MLGWFQGYRAYRVWMGTIVLFLMSGVQSCSELKHSIWGKTARAHIDRVEPSAYSKNRDSYIAFSFVDHAGKSHFVKRTVSNTRLGEVSAGQTVDVIYFAAVPEKARLVAERSFFWPIIFLGMIGFAVIWSFVSYRQLQAGDFSAVR